MIKAKDSKKSFDNLVVETPKYKFPIVDIFYF